MPYSIKGFANIKKDYSYFLSLIQSFTKQIIRNIQKLIPSRVIYCKNRLMSLKNIKNNKMNCELMLPYDTAALWQTGSRNLTGQKRLPTIWGTYMKLVTKYQISAINSC